MKPVAPKAALEAAGANEIETYDLIFIGAGVSTSYTLLNLFEALSEKPLPAPLRIGVIEREPDAFSGVPYGRRAARTALLITSLRDFLPEGERQLFASWLMANKDWVFRDFRAAAGPLGTRWWTRHHADVNSHNFDALFLPRYAFGAYMEQRVRSAIYRAKSAGLATTDVITDEVRSVDPVPGAYRLRCVGRALSAHRVVLGVGSPPTFSRLVTHGSPKRAVLLDRPFDEVRMAVDRVQEGLKNTVAGRPPHVVLVGGDASAMDMLYQTNDQRIPEARQVYFTVLSLRGQLPERMAEGNLAGGFVTAHLRRLETADRVSALEIYEAALADIALGRRAGLSGAGTVQPISAALTRVLPRLSVKEAMEFAGRWGAELGRHQRRAGWEYREVVENLAREGRIRLIAGAFAGVEAVQGGGVHVRYQQYGAIRTISPPADVVINCSGPTRDLRTSASPLLEELLRSGLCRLTPTGVGIAVDSSLEAAPRFHVIGPLLAGNVVNGYPIWHMEHCGRISSFGALLGAVLAQSLESDAVQLGLTVS